MSSKQLKSILSKTPSATIVGEKLNIKSEMQDLKIEQRLENMERLVARVPTSLKEEIRHYIRKHKGETETTILMKGLKLMGFNVSDNLLVDKRTLR